MSAEIEQNQIETKRLILRPYSENDINDVFDYASDSAVAQYVLWEPHKTIDDSKSFLDWVKSVTKNEMGNLFFIYAIELKSENKVIGSIDFKNTNKYGAQMDYALGKKYWGQGFMTEAANALKIWAFDQFPDLVRLQSFCESENIGSSKVMEKIGMEYEGLRRKSCLSKGRLVDLVHYALIRDIEP